MRRAKSYMRSRQVQKLSADGPRVSVSPAMARWKAWLCRLGRPGTPMPWRSSPSRGGTPGSTDAIRPSRVTSLTSPAQPSGSSASLKCSAVIFRLECLPAVWTDPAVLVYV